MKQYIRIAMWLNLHTENEVNTFIVQWTSELNWEKSDIIDEFIILRKGVNALIPTTQYKYLCTHRYNIFGSSKLITICWKARYISDRCHWNIVV